MWNCPNNSIRGSQLKTFAEILDLTIAFPDSPLACGSVKGSSVKNDLIFLPFTSSSGVANSDDQKANILASTLQNNFSENKRPGDGRHPIDQEITNTLNNFFDNHPLIPISPTEPDEILNYIKSLKNNKAPGSDLITNKMIWDGGTLRVPFPSDAQHHLTKETAVLHKELEWIDSSVLYLELKLAWCCNLVFDGGRGFRKGSNGVEDGWPGDPSQPMRWMMGVSMNSD
ncbi:hypothetical protein TNCV_4763131 [Trichonephila clavipes]|nr:hypothetical protein TNCV_4763131 [Trichonephila clavipes]